MFRILSIVLFSLLVAFELEAGKCAVDQGEINRSLLYGATFIIVIAIIKRLISRSTSKIS